MPLPTPVKKRLPIPGEDLDKTVQDSAMNRLAEGLEGPSQGLQAGIGQGRSAVAQFAKDTQRQAAQTAVKGGSLGQGTQTALGQQARQSVMSQLGANEANNAKMISDEGKAFMDKALDIGQQNKQMKQQQGQFDVTAGQENTRINNQASQFNTSAGQEQQKITNQASQFATSSGQNQQQIDNQKNQFQQTLDTNKDQFAKQLGQDNLKLVASLGADIPGIASKVMGSALGQAGVPLTEPEKADLGKWYTEQKAKGEKIDAQMDTLIQKMITDATAPKSAMATLTETQANDDLTTNTLSKKLQSGENLSPDEYSAGIKAGAFPQFTTQTIPTGDNVKGFLAKNPSGVINLDGKPYKVISGSNPRTGYSTTGQPRHTSAVELQDPATGKKLYAYNGKIAEELPHQVKTSDYWGF